VISDAPAIAVSLAAKPQASGIEPQVTLPS